MRRALAPLVVLPLLACGGGATQPLGQLENPVAVAVHQPTSRVFIANRGSDELRLFDPAASGGSGSFVLGPAVLFALSIPTVSRPEALGAAGRHVFVLSREGSEVGFVDLEAEGAFGPRSVDGPDGFPVTQALPFLPATLTAFASRFATPDGNADHALVVGNSSALGGSLVAVRPPGPDGAPALTARIELPEEFPVDVALDPSGEALALEGAAGPIDDCRAMAIADARYEPGVHEPGVWLTRAVVSPSGALRVDGPGDPGVARVAVRVPVQLLDGTLEVRAAPVRAVAFVPAPLEDAALAAIVVDPCALRSGRLVALLDEEYCAGADPRTCPDVAMVDLPSGELAVDEFTGGPAAYAIPGAAQGAQVLPGPFAPVASFRPVASEGGAAITREAPVPTLALVTSTSGAVYFFAPGFGPYLRGPTPADRAAPDSVFPLDADEEGPRASAPVRTDARRRTVELSAAPTIDASGAAPRDEVWNTGFLAPLPGLDRLGPVPDLAQHPTVTLPAGSEVTFLDPVAVLADPDPTRADRVVPVTGTVRCPGHPVTGVAADGRSLTVQVVPQGQAACDAAGLPLAVVPAEATPWWLSGSVTGFVGRLPGEVVEIWADEERLFTFTGPAFTGEELERAAFATWSFTTDDGFTAYGAFPDVAFQLPADIDAWLRSPPSADGGADWRVFVPYSGGDALIEFDPDAPTPPTRIRVFQ